MPRLQSFPDRGSSRPSPLESDIVALRSRDPDATGPATMPTGGWPRMVLALAEMAVRHVASGELDVARTAVIDALTILDCVPRGRVLAEASVLLGEALLGLGEAPRTLFSGPPSASVARERFEVAAVIFDELGDKACAARARLGLGRALLVQRDPSACAVLEDAGTLYEDLGDEALVLAIDRALRDATAELEQSPRSFASSSRFRMRAG